MGKPIDGQISYLLESAGFGEPKDLYPSAAAPIFIGIQSGGDAIAVSGDTYAHDRTANNVRVVGAKWGFDFSGRLVFNSRGETVTQKPMFANLFNASRCAVYCDGYYEWDKEKKKYFFSFADGGDMFLGGLCEKKPDAVRYSIVTRAAVGEAATVHHRMPIIMNKSEMIEYLSNRAAANDFLTRVPPNLMLKKV